MSLIGRVLLTVDVALNVLTLGRVETISSRCGRQVTEGSPCRVCSFICKQLDRWWPGHCANNIVTPLDKG